MTEQEFEALLAVEGRVLVVQAYDIGEENPVWHAYTFIPNATPVKHVIHNSAMEDYPYSREEAIQQLIARHYDRERV